VVVVLVVLVVVGAVVLVVLVEVEVVVTGQAPETKDTDPHPARIGEDAEVEESNPFCVPGAEEIDHCGCASEDFAHIHFTPPTDLDHFTIELKTPSCVYVPLYAAAAPETQIWRGGATVVVVEVVEVVVVVVVEVVGPDVVVVLVVVGPEVVVGIGVVASAVVVVEVVGP
jgi:hypothetical protein